MEAIKYEDFAKAELRVGTVVAAREHPNADKLLVLTVSLGLEERQIVAGIKQHRAPAGLVGKQIVVVANLEPRTLRGEQSHGMLLAASDDSGQLALLTVDEPMLAGSVVK